ncbi:hypothetical protein BGZ94_002331 [Podila epigama]|nr:hypothetical protein BGZ94_002331 [Podila epigama]
MTQVEPLIAPAAPGTAEAAAVQSLYAKSLLHLIDGVAYTTDEWINWGGNVSSKPEKTFHPKTLNDLKVIIREANTHKKKIRCAGSGHSWCAAAISDDYLVNTKEMNKIHDPVQSQEHGWTVTIETGVLVSELDDFLRDHNPPLALPSNVVPGVVRYGGVLSMGCHGASISSSTMSDMITEMTILNAKGELVTYTEAKDHEAFSAACLNLGLLGIIYTATLKVEVMNTRLRALDSNPSLDALFGGADAGLNLKAMVLKNDSTQFLHWPFKHFGQDTQNDNIWLKQWTRTTEAAQNDDDSATGLPEVDHPFFTSFKVGEQILEIPDAIHFPMGDADTTLVAASVAFKVDADFKNAVEAFKDLVARNYAFSKSGPSLRNTVLDMRFIKSSNKTLSPVYDQDPDAIYCMLTVLAASNTPGFDDFAASCVAHWINRYDAKTQWAKMWENVPQIYSSLRRAYGDRLVRFNRIRQEQDPEDMFVNSTFEPLLAEL